MTDHAALVAQAREAAFSLFNVGTPLQELLRSLANALAAVTEERDACALDGVRAVARIQVLEAERDAARAEVATMKERLEIVGRNMVHGDAVGRQLAVAEVDHHWRIMMAQAEVRATAAEVERDRLEANRLDHCRAVDAMAARALAAEGELARIRPAMLTIGELRTLAHEHSEGDTGTPSDFTGRALRIIQACTVQETWSEALETSNLTDEQKLALRAELAGPSVSIADLLADTPEEERERATVATLCARVEEAEADLTASRAEVERLRALVERIDRFTRDGFGEEVTIHDWTQAALHSEVKG